MGYMRDALRNSRLDEFDPLRDLPPTLAWYDFAELTGADGSAVAFVRDKSGFGNDLVQPTTSARPTKQTGEDGKPVIRLASQKAMACPQFGAVWPIAQITSPITLVVTFKAASSVGSLAGKFPLIFGGSDTNTVKTYINGDTETMTVTGRVASTQSGPSVKDDAWHVVVATVDSGAALLYLDGYLASTGSGTVGTDTISNLALGATSAASTFVGDIREARVFQGRLSPEQITALTQHLVARAPAAITLDTVGRAPGMWEQTTSPNGQACRVFTPVTPSTPKTLVLWSHPHGQTEGINPSYFLYPFVNRALAKGWYVAASNMHANSWGNNIAIADLVDLYTMMSGRDTFTKVVLVGGSMGGVATALAVSRGSIPNIVGAYFIDAVLDLAAIYANATYTQSVKDAYGIASDGSDYASKTAGNNPILATASTYNKRLRFTASSADASVAKSSHTDAFRTYVSSVAVESALKTHVGGHLVGIDSKDISDFVARCVA